MEELERKLKKTENGISLLEMTRGVLQFESFQAITNRQKKKVNKVAEEKLKHFYCEIASDLLTLFVNEQISKRCLENEKNFFKMCKGKPDLSLDSGFWHFIFQNENNVLNLLDHFISIGNQKLSNKLTYNWRKNLTQLIPFFATKEGEKELLVFVTTWISSPELTLDHLKKWQNVMARSQGSIRLVDLRNLLSLQDSSRWFEMLQQALEEITTKELSTETSYALFAYLESAFELNVTEVQQGKNRTRLVVAQKVMFLSGVKLPELMKRHPKVQEINLYAKKTLFVDCDLKNNVFHGKNLAVVAGHVVVLKKDAHFDVSGLHKPTHLRPSVFDAPPSGTDGEPGRDGEAGESSGNVTIVAEEITNASFLTVRMCGGNGEGGQDGGPGGNGAIGKGVSQEELDSLCVQSPNLYWRRWKWFRDHEPGQTFQLTDLFLSDPDVTKKQYLLYRYKDVHGRRIEYSFAGRKRNLVSPKRYDLYFVVYGGEGSSCGIGGQNGVSGEGGRNGEHTAISVDGRPLKGINWEPALGTDGCNNGKCGKPGKPGKHGNDMAFVDRSEVGKFKFYIGSSGEFKLIQKHYCNPTTDRRSRFNGYLKYEQLESNCYVWFDQVRPNDLVSTRKAEKRTESDRPAKSKAVSQQAIFLDEILGEFNKFFVDSEVELTLEEAAFDNVVAEEETEQETQMEETLTVLRSQVEDIGAHEINVRSQRPSEDQILIRILAEKEQSLVKVVNLIEESFQVCLDCKLVEVPMEKLFCYLESEENWAKEAENGVLKNGMNQEDLMAFAVKARNDWKEKLSLSSIERSIDMTTEASMELLLENDELVAVCSAPVEGDFWKDINTDYYCKNLIKRFMAGMPKYWMDHNALVQVNRIYKELKNLEVLDRFASKNLDWSNLDDVQKHIKSFKNEGNEAEVATEATFLDLKMDEKMTKKVQAVKYQLRNLKEKTTNFVSGKESQFAEVQALLERTRWIENVFGPLREILDLCPDLQDRFTLKIDQSGNPKPVGSHTSSLIFMRFFSEQILDFCSKLFRYHLKSQEEASTPTKWLTTADLTFANYSEFTYKSAKKKLIPIDKLFKDHMENGELRSASYRLLLAEHKNVNLQVFCESGYAKMRLVENVNVGAGKTVRLFLNRQGNVTSIAPCISLRKIYNELKSCELNIPLPQSKESDLTEFVNSFAQKEVSEWMQTIEVSTGNDVFLRFLRRLFELRGFDLSLTELQFLFNTVIDCVCNNDFPLEKLCFLLLDDHGSLYDVSLALRIVSKARGDIKDCKSLMELADQIRNIKDKRLQALLGSKLHELDWLHYREKLPILFNMLAHAENSFSQLEDRPLKEWIDIAECQKWDNYEPLNGEYGTAGYFFILLELAEQQGGRKLRVIVNELKKNGCFLYEKMVSRLTYLIYYNELEFNDSVQQSVSRILGRASKLVECLREKKKSGVWMIDEERLQQQWMKDLKELPDWKKVFPQNDRSLEELIKLTTNPMDSDEERRIRLQGVKKIERMILSTEEECTKTLQRIDDVLFKKRNIRLRNTQKIAILSAYNHPKNLLCQVNTGEGKSFIIVSLAILKILLNGGSVDIITSSSLLAQRDAKNMKDIYDAFDLTVGHNCDEQTEERKKGYSCDVVYGDISHFQRDHLLHNFYKRNILGGRQKECVIVDEVDSMFLDNGGNMLYLSHNIPGLELLDSLFVFIHREVHTQIRDGSTALSEKVRKAVLVDLFGIVTKDDIEQLLLHEKQAPKIATVWRHLVKNNIVDSEGVVQEAQSENILNLEAELTSSCGIHLTKRIMAMLLIVHNRKREICVPAYLHPFILHHLNAFVDSALKAVFLKHEDEYVVDIDRINRTSDMHPVITIIDKSTGTDLSSSQWSDGLHQFLQLKHGCRQTPLNLKAVFISNISCLNDYKNIYGFSGTLGSKVESDSLRELYNADVVRIPTCKPKEFNENAPVLVREQEEWIDAIYNGIYNQFDAGRSVLLVCKSIDDVGKLYQRLASKAKNSVLKDCFVEAVLYRRDFDDFDFETSGGLLCRKLIISTNLAGRGTDIQLNKELIDCGGLHVIVSFLPENTRVEDQAYGRAARCGQPGSGQIIALIDKHASGANNIFQLKQFRDNAEVHRLRSLKQFYDYHIAIEEKCLQMFQDHCSGALTSIYAVSEEELPSRNQVIYFALLDEWATWLDNEAERIKRCEKNASDTEKAAIMISARRFLSSHPIPTDWDGKLEEVPWLKRPQPLLTLAQILMKEDKYEGAEELLKKISEEFGEFSAEANYYMGVVVQRKIRRHKKFRRGMEKEIDVQEGEKEPKNKKKGVRLWLGNKIEDGANWTQDQLQKINNLEYSPEYFVEISEEHYSKATTLFVKAKAVFMKRIKQKRLMHTVVAALQQTSVVSGGYAKQQMESIAVLEALIGNIDNILGGVPKPSDVLLADEGEHLFIPRMNALRQAGIVSPTVLLEPVDAEMLQAVAYSSCLPLQLLLQFIDSIRQDDDCTEYENCKVVEKEMLSSLPLPSAIGFWRSMQRAGCLLHERYYIGVKKTTKINPLETYSPVTLQMDIFDVRLTENNLTDYLFYDLLDANLKSDYSCNLTLHEMMECDLAYIEVMGTMNPLVVCSIPKMDQFDFINMEILEEELGLDESEAKWILNKLLDVNMLEEVLVEVEEEHSWKDADCSGKATTGACCPTVFVEKTRIDLEVFPESMRDSLGTVFARHFSYGYALRALAGSVEESLEGQKKVNHRILLPQAPYADLYEDLLNSGILINGRVTQILDEIYEPEKPMLGRRRDYLPQDLYKKLSKMTPWIKVNSIKLQSSQEYMRETCVPASAEIQMALANGMRQVAYIEKPKLWRWFFGIFTNVGNFLASCAFSRIGSSSKTVNVLVPAVAGSMFYFVSLFKQNRQMFAKTNVSYAEEFTMLRESHDVSVQRRDWEKNEFATNEKLQIYAENITTQLRHFILSHSLLTTSEMPLDGLHDTIQLCIRNSPLLPMLHQTVSSFLSIRTRKALLEMISQIEKGGECDFTFNNPSGLLLTVIAFATTLIIDVNKSIRLKNRNNKEKLAQIGLDVISRKAIRDAMSSSSVEDALNSEAITLKTVLCKEMHQILEKLVKEAMETSIQPLVNEMIETWREENAPAGGDLCFDETTRQKKSAEYSAERLAKSHNPSDFMSRDLHNIFLKMCFREQRQAVVCHMVRYNYPLSAHCSRLIMEGVLTLFEELGVSIGQVQMSLIRNKDTIDLITAGRKIVDGTYLLTLFLKNDCFYVTENDNEKRNTGHSSGLFEALCGEVDEIASEFSLGSDLFRSRLENAIKDPCFDPSWRISENWLANEKILCSVPF